MAIDPEIIPPSSSKGYDSARFVPKWAFYLAISLGVFVLIGILKVLLPLIVMSLLVGFIWRQATK